MRIESPSLNKKPLRRKVEETSLTVGEERLSRKREGNGSRHENSRQKVTKMARKNTPATYACGNCNAHGHNRRTCPELGLAPKAKPVKKPRAKKVIEETVAPLAPMATEEQIEALRELVATIEAANEATATAREEDEREFATFDAEPTDAELAEIEASEVDAAFEAEVADAASVTDEEAAAFLDEFAALFA